MIKKILLGIYFLGISAVAGTTIIHYGVEYEEVTSPNTGRIWLDRNLGALKVCTLIDDKECFGNYYQWGRNQDGHEQHNSRTVTTLSKSINNAGKYFIQYARHNYGDWVNNLKIYIDLYGELRIQQWAKTDGSSVCPVKYRVPTGHELQEETTNTGMRDANDMFQSFLKFPTVAERGSSGPWGNIWVNTAATSSSEFLYYDTHGSIQLGATNRAHGFSVRCIKD